MPKSVLMPVSYVKVGYRWEPPDGDFIVEVQPIIAQTVNLCGYELDFKKEREPSTGQMVYPIYTLDSRKFPPLVKQPPQAKKIDSVLPEMLTKLTNPLAQVVMIVNTKKVEPLVQGGKVANTKKAEKIKPKGK